MSETKGLIEGHTIIEEVSYEEPELIHIAVSYAGLLLADLGATVIRVVPPADPLSRLRSSPLEPAGETSVLATYLNRKKRLVSAPVTDAADLVLKGSNESSSLGCAQVCVSADIDGEKLPVSELGVQGLVGLTDLFGEPGQQPLMMNGHQSAYALGYAVFCAAMASLTKADNTNEVDIARVNAIDALAWVNWKGVAAGALGFPVARGGKGAEAPVVRCADGHFAFMYLPNNWEDIKAEIGDSRLEDEQFSKAGRRAKNAQALNEIIAEWAADKSWSYIYEFCQRCAIPGGPILYGSQLIEDPLYQHRAFFEEADCSLAEVTKTVTVPGIPLTVEDTAEVGADAVQAGIYSPNTPTKLPLSGKLVLDLGIFTAGSVTSTLLADLGATVIKIESQSYSDPFRIWPGIKGDSPLFTFNNRNKIGLNLDLKTEAGKADFLKLVQQADVVVENFRRGVLKRLGIDYPVLKTANPNIVLASISGQGASGPGSGHVSFGSTLEAIGGVAALTGYPGGSCYISGRNLNYPDQIVCLYGAGAVMAALLNTKTTKRGMHIDVSQREVTTLAVGEVIAAASLFGDPDDFPGNRDLNAQLQDIYPVADEWLCITVARESEAIALAQMLECETDDLEGALKAWLGTQTVAEAIRRLRGLGVAAFKANTGAEAAEEPAIKSGHAFAVTAAGEMVKGFPFQFEKDPLAIYEESPKMGEHTDQILRILAETQ